MAILDQPKEKSKKNVSIVDSSDVGINVISTIVQFYLENSPKWDKRRLEILDNYVYAYEFATSWGVLPALLYKKEMKENYENCRKKVSVKDFEIFLRKTITKELKKIEFLPNTYKSFMSTYPIELYYSPEVAFFNVEPLFCHHMTRQAMLRFLWVIIEYLENFISSASEKNKNQLPNILYEAWHVNCTMSEPVDRLETSGDRIKSEKEFRKTQWFLSLEAPKSLDKQKNSGFKI